MSAETGSDASGVAVPFLVQTDQGPSTVSLPSTRIATRQSNVRKPDHRTRPEWNTVGLIEEVSCVAAGTRIDASWTDLIPEGAYSMWSVSLDRNGQGVLKGLGGSTVGRAVHPTSDGSGDLVLADATGRAAVSILQPMTAFQRISGREGCSPHKEDYRVVASYRVEGSPWEGGSTSEDTPVLHARANFER